MGVKGLRIAGLVARRAILISIVKLVSRSKVNLDKRVKMKVMFYSQPKVRKELSEMSIIKKNPKQ